MPEFLAETYAPGIVSLRAGDIALAADQVSAPGTPARFLGAIFLPDEENCLSLYQAASASAVRAAMTRAQLQPERITQAVSIKPHQTALDEAERVKDRLPRSSKTPIATPITDSGD